MSFGTGNPTRSSDSVNVLCVFMLATLVSACGGSGGDGGLREALENIRLQEASALQAIETSPDPVIPANDIPDTSVPVATEVIVSRPDKEQSPTLEEQSSSPLLTPVTDKTNSAPSPAVAVFTPSSTDLSEPQTTYQQDGYGTKNVIRMDVVTQTSKGTCTAADISGCTLANVKADTDKNDDLTVKIPVHFTADDFADDGRVTNAELRQRGGTTRQAPQKSFKIKLEDKDALWRTERSMLLNKHPYENDRIRNKLAFDLMSEIPHLLSFRTQFVNLWIDDGEGAKDYGLYTHVESAGSRYLRRRALDDQGRLYKINLFNFSQSDLRSVAVDAQGLPLDEDRFEARLDIEAGDDHRPLVKMLTDLHDPAIPFETVLEKYFNENNVLTWLTVNLLLHQTDAISQNYLLFNPVGTERFYFLPWDYDGGFAVEPLPPADMTNSALQKRLFYGYARAINNDFITRYYQRPGAHKRFIEAAAHIRKNWLTDERINELAAQYGELVKPWQLRLPDSAHNPNYNEYSPATYSEFVASNEQALSTSFHIPMPPVLIEDPQLVNGEWIFEWKPAFDLTGRKLTYEFQISSSPQFQAAALLARHTGLVSANTALMSTRVDAARIDSGRKYVRVIARSDLQPERFWQVSNNQVRVDGVDWVGAMAFDPP